MNLGVLPAESLFKRADGGRCRVVWNCFKLQRRRHQLLNLPEIFKLIGRNPNGATRGQSTMEGGQKPCGHYSARSMTTLRPWIGKQQMKHSDRVRRDEVLSRVGEFTPQDARVGDTVRGNLMAGTSHPANQTLNAQKISLWIDRGSSQQEGAIATAKIDFEGSGTAINRAEVERRKKVCRHNLGLGFYGDWFGGLEHLHWE